MKLCPKQDCIITQSTAPGSVMSVARKNDVFALQSRNAFVVMKQMWHDLIERTLPFARSARTWTIVRSMLAGLFVLVFSVVWQHFLATVY